MFRCSHRMNVYYVSFIHFVAVLSSVISSPMGRWHSGVFLLMTRSRACHEKGDCHTLASPTSQGKRWWSVRWLFHPSATIQSTEVWLLILTSTPTLGSWAQAKLPHVRSMVLDIDHEPYLTSSVSFGVRESATSWSLLFYSHNFSLLEFQPDVTELFLQL